MSDIVERFARVCRDTPERQLVYVPSSGVRLTAGMIWRAGLRERERLSALGLGPDHLLLCAAGNRAALLPLWLACRSAGMAIMPIDGSTTATEIASLGRAFGGTVAVLPDRIARAAEFEVVGHVEGLAFVRIQGAEPKPELHAGAAALKLTSGSTGLPKAAFTTEAQLVYDAEHIVEAMDIRPDDWQLASIPLSHAYGIGNLLLPLLIQGTAFVLRDGFVPHQFVADVASHGVRLFPGVPFMFQHLLTHLPGGQWPGGLRLLTSAGARLEPATALQFHERFGQKIHSFYGTSETGGIAFDDSPEVAAEASVGRPLRDVRVTLRSEEGAPAGSGRVHVAGTAVSRGYAGSSTGIEDFTAGGFLTGDFGRLNASGHLVLTGRASAFINVAGRKVQPEEVEQVLRQIPGVVDARVIGAADPVRGQQVVACLVAPVTEIATLAVRAFCGARLAPHKIPRTVVHLDRIPLTERGKTDRARLEAIVREHLDRHASAGML